MVSEEVKIGNFKYRGSAFYPKNAPEVNLKIYIKSVAVGYFYSEE